MTNKEYIERRDGLVNYIRVISQTIDGTLVDDDKQIAYEEIDELINDIAFAAMESCEPDCDEVRHAKHQGSWDTMNRIDQIVGADETN